MLSVNSCTKLFRPLATSSVAVPIVVAGIVELLNVIFRVPRCLAPHRTGKTSQGGEESKREEKEKKMGATVGQHAWWVESIWHGPQLGWSPYGPRPVPSNLMKRAVPLIAQTLLWQTYTSFENLDYVKRARYILQCSKRAGKDGTCCEDQEVSQPLLSRCDAALTVYTLKKGSNRQNRRIPPLKKK